MSDLSGYNSYNLLQQVPFQIGQSASVSFTKLELGALSDFSTRPTKALLFSIVKIWRGLWRVYEIKKYLLCIYFTIEFLSFTATTKLNTVFFNLSASDIGTEERIVSVQIRALIKTTVPDSPLPQRGRLVLYDGLSRTAVYSKEFQGGGTRWYVFPARALVKRWIFSPHLNHGVYLKVKSHVPRVKQSLLVDVNVKAPRNKRPLLIVETDDTKVQGIKDITSLMR